MNNTDLENLADIDSLSEYMKYIISIKAELNLLFIFAVYRYVFKSLLNMRYLSIVDPYYFETYQNYKILYQSILEFNDISI